MLMTSSYGPGNSNVSLADVSSDENTLDTEEAMDDPTLGEVHKSCNGTADDCSCDKDDNIGDNEDYVAQFSTLECKVAMHTPTQRQIKIMTSNEC